MEIDYGIDNNWSKAIKDGAHIAPRLPSLSYFSIHLLIRAKTTSPIGCLLQRQHCGVRLLVLFGPSWIEGLFIR